jgi:alcohol dehydrogenase (NADP+)
VLPETRWKLDFDISTVRNDTGTSEEGEALQAGLAAGGIAREDIFVTTKLRNTNHRPERVERAFEASLNRLGLNHLDLYLIHTPFAFRPGDDQDPRDQNGNILYDRGVTLFDTWWAMESMVEYELNRAL